METLQKLIEGWKYQVNVLDGMIKKESDRENRLIMNAYRSQLNDCIDDAVKALSDINNNIPVSANGCPFDEQLTF